jgi:hypothetical protein
MNFYLIFLPKFDIGIISMFHYYCFVAISCVDVVLQLILLQFEVFDHFSIKLSYTLKLSQL